MFTFRFRLLFKQNILSNYLKKLEKQLFLWCNYLNDMHPSLFNYELCDSAKCNKWRLHICQKDIFVTLLCLPFEHYFSWQLSNNCGGNGPGQRGCSNWRVVVLVFVTAMLTVNTLNGQLLVCCSSSSTTSQQPPSFFSQQILCGGEVSQSTESERSQT